MLGYQASATMPAAYHHRAAVEADKLAGRNPAFDGLLADMKTRGTILDATLYVYELLDKMKGANPAPYCRLALAEKLAGEAWRAGVPISAGTDAETDWKEPMPALADELALLVHGAGMTPMDAIRAATSVASRTIGQERDMGTLEKGKLANIVFVTKNPLAAIENIKTVALTVKRGMPFARRDYRPITKEEAKDADKE
jgi:imidazolonepropionase-like amidohydrolase